MRILKSLLTLLFFISLASPVNASTDEITFQDNFNYNGHDYKMVIEYLNPQRELNDFLSNHSEFYNDIYLAFGGISLTESSISSFKLKENELYTNNLQKYLEFSDDFDDFNSFLDIYENTFINSSIRSYVNLKSVDENINYIFENLPYDEAVLFRSNNLTLLSSTISKSTRAIKNISAGVSYAQQYALAPNTIDKYNYFLGTDCTNFGSQIMEAMGVLQNYPGTNDAYKGWWHKITKTYNPYTNSYDYTHYYSSSFINTQSFALYFGIYNKYTSFLTFSQNVKVGDFILIDESRDDAWDHLGFVTSISPSSSTYIDENGVSRTYYNFKVAQHSSNYHAFVNSSTNNWEQKNNTRTYGILKR